MPSLFISYRRSDSPDTVKLIYERLKKRYEYSLSRRAKATGQAHADPASSVCGRKWEVIPAKQPPGRVHVRSFKA
jgi:hypothetical protein